MKNNSGITVITLVITIIVIVLIASITIYSGLDAVDSMRTKEAKDTTNAIYLALIANEDIIPTELGKSTMLSDHTIPVDNRQLTSGDYALLGLDYSPDNITVVFDKNFDETTSKVTYNFTYTRKNKTYKDLIYSMYVENFKINTRVEFDESLGVNRPIIIENIQPINYEGEDIKNTYAENWYNYQKNVSHLATAKYNGKMFVWIPRFAYKIQDFYLYKSYNNVPDTAVDIVFLREDTNYMSNNEVLNSDYFVHPAFSSGEAGFWIETEASKTGDIDDAIAVADGNSYFMRNSEYAAAVLLSKYLNNNQIIFGNEEYVAAVCDENAEDFPNFDLYYTDYDDVNNVTNVLGHAMVDTPWELKGEKTFLPDANNKYIIREPKDKGLFYFRASDGNQSANYRVVLKSNI